MDQMVFLTFFVESGDTAQQSFVLHLQETFKDLPERENISAISTSSSTNEGLSLMVKGEGALAMDDIATQLWMKGYFLSGVYRTGNKVTFMARKGSPQTEDELMWKEYADSLLMSLTSEAGWTVKKYNNSGSVAFAAKDPVNLAAKLERAAKKGKVLSFQRVQLFA